MPVPDRPHPRRLAVWSRFVEDFATIAVSAVILLALVVTLASPALFASTRRPPLRSTPPGPEPGLELDWVGTVPPTTVPAVAVAVPATQRRARASTTGVPATSSTTDSPSTATAPPAPVAATSTPTVTTVATTDPTTTTPPSTDPPTTHHGTVTIVASSTDPPTTPTPPTTKATTT